MNFIPKDEIVWKKIKYLRQGETLNYDYALWLNEPLASWDVFDYWERERVESMRKHLKKGNVLFDIGAEQGWLSAVLAQIVGAESMVLVEPTWEFWPNIRAIFKQNKLPHPLGLFTGFFGDVEDGVDYKHKKEDWDDWYKNGEPPLIDRNKYRNLHDQNDKAIIPYTTIDRYCSQSDNIPAAINIDTEGSELLVLRGAKKTLMEHKPKIWVSVHPDMALRDYGVKENELDDYLKSLGYTGEHLATDHEEHWYYERD